MPKLPAELWLAIFDLLIVPSLSPAALCNVTNFPVLSLHLRHPREYAPIEYPYAQLRLICRAFRDLLGPSPYFFVRNTTESIPATARVIYTPLHQAPTGYLQRVLRDPYRARRIVTLYITCTRSEEHILPLDSLCGSSRALVSLRNLTLSIFYLHAHPLKIRLWSRIKKAFPLLVCLVLLSALKRVEAFPVHTAHETSPVIFEHLQILDMGCFVPSPRLRLPVLRHAALNHCSQRDLKILLHSPLLESLHLRGIEYGARIDLSSLPQVLSLGIPVTGDTLPLPLPPDYPLCHICLYMPSICSPQWMISWVTDIPTLYPAISCITIDLTMLPELHHAWIRRVFIDVDLQASGLAVAPATVKGHLIILERIPAVTRPELPGPTIEPAPSSELVLSSELVFQQSTDG
jgi:hypothetical protein